MNRYQESIDLSKEIIRLEIDARDQQNSLKLWGQRIREAIRREVEKQIKEREFELYKENLKLKDKLLKESEEE